MPPSQPSSCSVAGSTKSTTALGPHSTSVIAREPRLRPRFPRASLRLLEQWLSTHRQSPYPMPSDLDHLTVTTRLKRSQISNWFANVRKRGKIPSSGPTTRSNAATSTTTEVSKVDDDLPLFHRWLNSWTDDEAASLPAILEAVSQLNGASSGDFLRGSTRFHRQFCPSESSLSSMEIRSYAANAKSVHSEDWKNADDISTTPTQSKRRHRRVPVHLGSRSCAEAVGKKAVSRKFQCTFCSDRFRTKYDWQRHEKSIHLPLEKWTCSPHGSVEIDPSTNQVTCTFCGIIDPTPEHIGAHGYTICASRPVGERTFYRKDHLQQHLRLMHRNCPLIPSMSSWKSVNTICSRCGFCDAPLNTWDDRVEHLAEHFCDGLSVAKDWVGGWGFDAEVSNMLERASLPGHSEKVKGSQDFTVPSLPDSMEYTYSFNMESSFFETEPFVDYCCHNNDNSDPAFMWDDSMPFETGFSNFGPTSTHETPRDGCVLTFPVTIHPPDGFEDDLVGALKTANTSTESHILDLNEISSGETYSAVHDLCCFEGVQFPY